MLNILIKTLLILDRQMEEEEKKMSEVYTANFDNGRCSGKIKRRSGECSTKERNRGIAYVPQI